MRQHRSARHPARCGGFTVAELTVTLFIVVLALLGLLALFDFNNRITRVQTHLATAQQNQRVAQQILVEALRLAGRGYVPAQTVLPVRNINQATLGGPTGLAIEVRNNVPNNTQIAVGQAGSPTVLPGTDVLIVRGVFTTPVYQLNYADDRFFVLQGSPPFDPTDPQPALASGGRIHVCAISPSGIEQDITPLQQAGAEPLVLVSPVDNSFYAVVENLPASPPAASAPCAAQAGNSGVDLQFRAINGTNTTVYQRISPIPLDGTGNPSTNMPANVRNSAFLGILEEYRYYIRDDRATTGKVVLSRARMIPGTELPYGGAIGNLSEDVVEDVIDLQVALGLDTDDDGVVTDAGNTADEWLYNIGGDSPAENRWTIIPGSTRITPIIYARVTTTVRTERPDKDYVAPLLTQIEDHDYSALDPLTVNGDVGRKYRRRQLQTVVQLRNL